ncbi:MAG: prepilin-type N-terminal cleavage/methylation domain-containing protein, partial [Methyloceanibacter sp.]|nr:prepilin-type N-terminal cleavage/methylation domain-containing protein [Methyloceanibacter sp.]
SSEALGTFGSRRRLSMRHRCRRVGYTLVELLIVIAAIAIFAGMVIPEVGSAVEDANRSAVLATVNTG